MIGKIYEKDAKLIIYIPMLILNNITPFNEMQSF